MDIPAPAKTEDKKPLDTTVSPTTAAEQEPSAPKVENAPKQEDVAAKIVELINSKKYNLNIKEKRTKPLLVLSLGIKRKKKPKNQRKSAKKTNDKKSGKKQMTQVWLLVALVGGLLLAVDIGWLNLGFELPFSLFGN